MTPARPLQAFGLPRVEVRWVDATTHEGWVSRNWLREQATLSECRTVGFLALRDRRRLVIVQSASDNDRVADAMVIPIACVRSVRPLRRNRSPRGR